VFAGGTEEDHEKPQDNWSQAKISSGNLLNMKQEYCQHSVMFFPRAFSVWVNVVGCEVK